MNKDLHQRLQLAELITKDILGEASQLEKEQLRIWLAASPANRQEYNVWMKRLKDDLIHSNSSDTEQAWKNLRLHIRPKRMLLQMRYLYAYAATLLLAVALGGLLYSHYESQNQLPILPGSPKAELITENGDSINIVPEYQFKGGKAAKIIPSISRMINNDGMLSYSHFSSISRDSLLGIYHTLNVPIGGEYQVLLSDSTHIYINSDSQIRYPVVFAESDSVREVFIKGEARFNVAHHAGKPFRVHTQHATIEVLGTVFNVHDYDNEHTTIVTLNEGSVKFIAKNKEYVLNPNEQIVWDKEKKQLSWSEVDASSYSSWVDGIFEFNSMPLEQIMRQLARWYNVSYQFDDEHLKNRLFTGAAFRGQSLEGLLSTIEKTTSIHFKIRKKVIHIY